MRFRPPRGYRIAHTCRPFRREEALRDNLFVRLSEITMHHLILTLKDQYVFRVDGNPGNSESNAYATHHSVCLAFWPAGLPHASLCFLASPGLEFIEDHIKLFVFKDPTVNRICVCLSDKRPFSTGMTTEKVSIYV